MANLIITIISIGLVAVAAIMGAYYGGTAFVQGQAKAYANAAVSQGDQISAAWNVYAAQNGGAYSNISLVSALSTSPTYLATVPTPPGQVTSSTANSAWTMADLTATGSAPSATSGGVYFRLTDDQNGVNTCNYVSQIAAGTSASATALSTNSTDMLGAGTVSTGVGTTARKFDCVFLGTTSITSPPSASTTPKYVYYRTY